MFVRHYNTHLERARKLLLTFSYFLIDPDVNIYKHLHHYILTLRTLRELLLTFLYFEMIYGCWELVLINDVMGPCYCNKADLVMQEHPAHSDEAERLQPGSRGGN